VKSGVEWIPVVKLQSNGFRDLAVSGFGEFFLIVWDGIAVCLWMRSRVVV